MKTKRIFFTLPRLIILGLFFLVSIFCLWLFLRSVLTKSLTNGIENMEIQGYRIGHGGIDITGFPFSIQTQSGNISVQAPSGDKTDVTKNWSVKLDQVSAKSATLAPLSWNFVHNGSARIDMHGVTGERYMFDVVPANLTTHASVSFNGTLKKADFNLGPSIFKPLVGTPPILSALENIKGDFSTSGTTGNLLLTGEKLIIQERALGALRNILGRELQHIEMDIDIYNWPTLQQNGPLYWQENMGRLASNKLVLKWGQIDFVGDFDIRFNEGTPDGTMHFYIKDTASLFDQLTQIGFINPAISGQAKLFLSTLKTDENGRQKIELTLRDNKLKYGFITLYQF